MNDAISLLYDGILNPKQVQAAMDAFVPESCNGASLFLVDGQLPVANHMVATGKMAEMLPDYYAYNTHGVALSAWLARQETTDFIFAADFYASEAEQFQNPLEVWIRQQHGIAMRSAARLNLHNGWVDALTLTFASDDRRVADRANAAMRPYIPHLARVLDLQRRFEMLQRRHQAVFSALDYFDVGIGITDRAGEVILVNRQMEEMLAARDGLSLDAGRRPVAATAKAGAITQAIGRVIATVTDGAGPATVRLSVQRRSAAADYIVDISPIRQTAPDAEFTVTGALILVIDPTRRAAIRADSFSDLFALTRAEMAVCELLLDGHTRTTISDIRGVSPETVKSQVGTVLGKTRTRNRADLIRLAVTINPPVLDRAETGG